MPLHRYASFLPVAAIGALLTGCGGGDADSGADGDQSAQDKDEASADTTELAAAQRAANEAAARSTLKAAIFPGMIQFAAGCYEDHDDDNRGEYGFLDQMAGQATTFSSTSGPQNYGLALVNPELGNATDTAVNGYHYVIYLPTNDGWTDAKPASDSTWYQGYEAQSDADRDAINLREQYFIAYAYPADADAGTRTFMISQDGKVLEATRTSFDKPVWHAAISETEPAAPHDLTVIRNPTWQRAQ